ncbi:MAG TPA: hypothetical protein VLG37_03035 [Candidatus Saccharimonadales bacterium]|nr:hypothetical protein [Candidatus Saccharimonadales bacterium]
MTEHDRGLADKLETANLPTVFDVFNTLDIYTEAGFPLLAITSAEYAKVGGLTLEAYDRGDSPSRDGSGVPYNATWFEHLKEHYSGGLKLLESLRQTYASDLTESGVIDGRGILELYRMGVNLPLFLRWRQHEPIRNGEIPSEMAVLRQALLGIGTVILDLPVDEIPKLTGKYVADKAEKDGDLVGNKPFPELPRMVCPASPQMIAGLAEALLVGNPNRGTSTLLAEYSVDIRQLQAFADCLSRYMEREAQLRAEIRALVNQRPAISTGFYGQAPKTKVELCDEIMSEYGKFLDQLQLDLYVVLGRTGQAPRMNSRRLYKTRRELLQVRVEVAESDDPRNLTPAVMADFDSLMPH